MQVLDFCAQIAAKNLIEDLKCTVEVITCRADVTQLQWACCTSKAHEELVVQVLEELCALAARYLRRVHGASLKK